MKGGVANINAEWSQYLEQLYSAGLELDRNMEQRQNHHLFRSGQPQKLKNKRNYRAVLKTASFYYP